MLACDSGLRTGDKLMIAGKTTYFKQDAESIFVDEVKVSTAKKGELIGLKVNERVRENDVVYRIVEV